ncbi:hypothetical protein QFZ83_006473 [Variovorax sp. W1I1]|uniref:hypothetical protein n=1 Tax=Variovorax sp. W1I1 TaxID=3042309 RepID=UPI0027892C8E|nr:hypothetical protein [Variovorax sp. W1I1]MDQ0612302.1 hypothetical protein [Variovorax sp. W1I1]
MLKIPDAIAAIPSAVTRLASGTASAATQLWNDPVGSVTNTMASGVDGFRTGFNQTVNGNGFAMGSALFAMGTMGVPLGRLEGVAALGTADAAAAVRHAAWGGDLGEVSGSIERLGLRALRQSGGDAQLSERLFEGYLNGVSNRLARTGSEFGIEIQPASLANAERVPNFIYLHRGGSSSPLVTWPDGTPRLYAYEGSRRLDAGVIDTTVAPNEHGLHPVVAGFDITLSATKPNIVPYYQKYFGNIPIYDIRLP